MEKQLKYILLLSLKDLALRRMSALLWSCSDISASISAFQFDTFCADEYETEWRETIEDNIKNKVLKLRLPQSLIKHLIDLVRPVSLDIRRWIESHAIYFIDSWDQIVLPDIRELRWTAEGTIDNRKTAEELVRRDMFCVVSSYELACEYCLEDYVGILWEKLPKDRKELYYNRKITEFDLKFLWPHILKGDLSRLDYLLRTSDRNHFTFYQYAFEHSAENGCRSATEYFFCKLTYEESDDSLLRSTQAVLTKIENFDSNDDSLKESIVSVLCYLLSVMAPAQRMKIFESRPVDVLFSFLDWPFQDIFLENVGLIWACLPPSSYSDLLQKMAYRYTDLDFYLPKAYQELFMQSPLDFKKCFVDQEHELNHDSASNFLSGLFACQDSETIGVIFRNMNAADRVKLVFQNYIFEYFYHCMLKNGWHMVEVCLQEATLSTDEKERLKKTFMEFLKREYRGRVAWGNKNLKRFFEFLGAVDVRVEREQKPKRRKLEN